MHVGDEIPLVIVLRHACPRAILVMTAKSFGCAGHMRSRGDGLIGVINRRRFCAGTWDEAAARQDGPKKSCTAAQRRSAAGTLAVDALGNHEHRFAITSSFFVTKDGGPAGRLPPHARTACERGSREAKRLSPADEGCRAGKWQPSPAAVAVRVAPLHRARADAVRDRPLHSRWVALLKVVLAGNRRGAHVPRLQWWVPASVAPRESVRAGFSCHRSPRGARIADGHPPVCWTWIGTIDPMAVTARNRPPNARPEMTLMALETTPGRDDRPRRRLGRCYGRNRYIPVASAAAGPLLTMSTLSTKTANQIS